MLEKHVLNMAGRIFRGIMTTQVSCSNVFRLKRVYRIKTWNFESLIGRNFITLCPESFENGTD